jgi:hypothetical protein
MYNIASSRNNYQRQFLVKFKFEADMNIQAEAEADEIDSNPYDTYYFTLKQFVAKHQAFTTGGMRSWIFNEHSNGLAKSGAIVRIGRKILIHEPKFFKWVRSPRE